MGSSSLTALERTALVVDDDPHVRQLCREVLEREGYSVCQATSTGELFSLGCRHIPDLIVTGTFSSTVDGTHVVGWLRSATGTRDAKIILLAHPDKASRLVATLEGSIDDYLIKPFRAEELAVRATLMATRQRESQELRRCRGLLGEQARILTLLVDFSGALSRTERLEGLVEEAVQVMASFAGCRRGAIMLPDSERRSLRISASIGLDEQTIADLTVPIGEGISGRVYESGSRFVVHSAGEANLGEGRYDSRLYCEPPAVAMAMCAPEGVVGVLYLTERVGRRKFTEEELEFLDLLSNNAASAIQSSLTRRARDTAHEAITVVLASLAEHRDDATGRHLERMMGYCLILARDLKRQSKYANKIDSLFIDDLRRAAPLHVVGKVGIPDKILLKPGKLMPEQIEIMRTHAAIGAHAIRLALARCPGSRFLMMAEQIAHSHHEWVEGSGYPRGLRGIAIPLCARIAALADVYDALTTRRVYKDALSHARARSIIRDLSGRQFDPIIVEAFLASEDAFQQLADAPRDDEHRNGDSAICPDGVPRASGAIGPELLGALPRYRLANGLDTSCELTPLLS